MTINVESAIEDLKNLQQNNQIDEKKFLRLYPYLSQTEDMSQQQNEQEGIQFINILIKSVQQKNPEIKLQEISHQEKLEQAVKIVELNKELYKSLQQENEKLQKMIQSIETIQQAKKQQQLANEQLEQTKNQFQLIQDEREVICKRRNNISDDIETIMKSMIRVSNE